MGTSARERLRQIQRKMKPDDPLPPSEVELRIERYLEALAAGARLDLGELARGLAPEERTRLRATALAHEYLARAANGEPVVQADFVVRLEKDEERRLFQQVVEDARAAGRVLPGELLPGTVLDGRYEIRREIGHGGMGNVYAALDRELEREVAVKVLKVAVGSPLAREREELFRRESKTLAKLKSRNIVAIHDVRRGREHSYIVMDLVPGQDLLRIQGRVREDRARMGEPNGRSPGPLRRAVGRAGPGERADLLGERTHERCAARIVREAARAVELAHQAGVVHRDLKPQNILLVPGGEPVLLDFGLASWRAGSEEEGFCGTPEYMAPEQIERASAGNDPRTDVYQLGLVLYELLTLRRAFPRRSGEELFPLFERIRTGRLQPARELVQHLSPSLEAVLMKALERDAARRYASARELREDLDRYLRRLPPIHARIAPARAAGLRAVYVARHPVTLVGAAALVAAYFGLREGPWAPPMKMEAFRTGPGGIELLAQGQPIELSGPSYLGLSVTVEQPTWLYVFSVFGPDSSKESRRLRPVWPDLLAPVLEPGYRPPRAFGPIQLDEGDYQVACTALKKPETYEGLFVYACAERNELLDRWQETIHEREQTMGSPVSLAEARKLAEDLSARVRGEGLDAFTAEERATISDEVFAADRGTGDDWRGRRWAPYDFLFPVSLAAPR